MADYPPKKNAAYVFYVSLISQADTKLAQANPTLAAGDVKVAVDDGAPANLATLPVVDADFTKRVKVSLSASEMNGDNITVIFSDAAGAEWCDLTVNIQTVTRQLADLAFPATSGRSLQVESDGMVHVDLKEWLGVAPDALISGDVPANAQVVADKTGYATTQADKDTLVDNIYDEARSSHVADGSFGQALQLIRTGTAQAGAAGSITLDGGASATDGFYSDSDVVCQIIAGTGAGQSRLGTGYTGSSKVLTVTPNWVVNPDNTSVFVLRPASRVDVAEWVGATVNALIAGRVPANVQAMANDVLTAAALAADAANEIRDVVATKICESEGNYTIQQILSILLAFAAGVTASNGALLKTPNGIANRISATVTTGNERTAMTLTPSS